MAEKKVTCRVKGSKGLWTQDKDGNTVHLKDGDKVSLTKSSALTHVKRGAVYASGEFEGQKAAAEAALKASQDEKAEREKPAEKKGGGSKES